MATLTEVTKRVLVEQDQLFDGYEVNEARFEEWVYANLGVDEPTVRDACLNSETPEGSGGDNVDPVGPIVDMTPQAAFLAGLVVGTRRDQWNG